MPRFWRRCSVERLETVWHPTRLLTVAFISDTEKAVNMIPLNAITDYQQLAYKLGKRMLEIGNVTNTLEFLQCCLRQVETGLWSDG